MTGYKIGLKYCEIKNLLFKEMTSNPSSLFMAVLEIARIKNPNARKTPSKPAKTAEAREAAEYGKEDLNRLFEQYNIHKIERKKIK